MIYITPSARPSGIQISHHAKKIRTSSGVASVPVAKTSAASARGADGGRVLHRIASRDRDAMWELLSFGHDLFRENRFPSRIMPDEKSERQQHVHHLLAVPRWLHVGDLAAAAIADAGL